MFKNVERIVVVVVDLLVVTCKIRLFGACVPYKFFPLKKVMQWYHLSWLVIACGSSYCII